MRKLREVLRLKFETDLSNRRVARSCGVSRPSVAEYLLRFQEAGLSWPQAAELDDATLERALYPPAPVLPAAERMHIDGKLLDRLCRQPPFPGRHDARA